MGGKKEKKKKDKEKKDKEKKEKEKATVRSAPDGSDNNTASIHCQTSCSFGRDDRHMELFDATVWGQFLKVVC